MAKFRQVRTNFSSGLLSRGMQGRLDLQSYNNGCELLTNWWPLITGGQRRRPGTFFLAQAMKNNQTTESLSYRLEPFIFSETQTYMVLFQQFSVIVFNPDDGAVIIDISNPSVIGDAPWTSLTLQQMSVAQLGDTMFIAHTNFQTRKLIRTDATTFVMSLYEFEKSPTANTFPQFAPFAKYASPEVTLQPSSSSGTVTFDASDDVFDSTYVGRLMAYRGKQFIVTQFVTPSQLVGDVKEQLDSGSKLTFAFTSGRATDFNIGEVIVGRDTGIKAEVVLIIDPTVPNPNQITVASISGDFAKSGVLEEVEGLDSGAVAQLVGVESTSPPAHANWEEQAFSTARGYPGVVAFHSQRLWFGGSSSLPAHIFGSKVAAFFNFNVGDGFPDESIQVLIADSQITAIIDMVSSNHLLIFTDSAEYYAPESEDAPLTPNTFNVLPQSRFGIKPGTRAKLLDQGVIYIQSNGKAVREFIWNNDVRGYVSEAISLLSEEAIQDVQEVTVLYGGYERPEHIAFFRNGSLGGGKEPSFISWYHTARSEQIRAWGRWDTQLVPVHDSSLDIGTALPQSDVNCGWQAIATLKDKLYCIAVRDIWDAGKQAFDRKATLERFELDATMDMQVRDDSTTAKSVWNGVHPTLAFVDVDVTNDFDNPNLTVNPSPDFYLGHFFLDSIGSVSIRGLTLKNIQAGLSFTQELRPMPVEIQLPDGFTVGQPKRIVSVDVLLNSTLAIRIDQDELVLHDVTTDFSLAPKAFSGNKKFYLLGYEDRPSVTLTNRIPLPCEVTAMSMEVEF